MWLLRPASGTGVRVQQHTAGRRLSTALLPTSSGDPSWGSSLEWVSGCAPRQHLFLLQACPKAVSSFAEGPAQLLHKVCFPDILDGHPILGAFCSGLGGPARKEASQAAASMLNQWLLCRPQLCGHRAWHAASKSHCGWESMVEPFLMSLLFTSCLIFFPFLSVEILWAGYEMGRHRAVDGRP